MSDFINLDLLKELDYTTRFDGQVKSINKVEELFGHANTVEKQYNAAKKRLNKLTQSIMAKALHGKLVAYAVNTEINKAMESTEEVYA